MKQQWHNSTLILNCTHDHTVARTQEPLYAYSCLHLHCHIVTGPHAFQHTLSPETNRWAQQTCTWAHRASVSVSDSWPQSTQLNKTAWMGVEAFTGLVETTWTGQQTWIKQLHLGLQHIPQHWKKVLHPIPHIQQNKNPQFFHIKKIWGFHLWPKGRKLCQKLSSSFGLPKPKYIYVFIKWAEVAVKCRLKLDTNQGPTMLKTLSKHWFRARKRLIAVIDISPSQTPRHKTADWRTRVL